MEWVHFLLGGALVLVSTLVGAAIASLNSSNNNNKEK